jgi:hypothetical protein
MLRSFGPQMLERILRHANALSGSKPFEQLLLKVLLFQAF